MKQITVNLSQFLPNIDMYFDLIQKTQQSILIVDQDNPIVVIKPYHK